MTPLSSVLKRHRISSKKRRLIAKCFAVDVTATQTAKIVSVNRNTVNKHYAFYRYLILKEQLKIREDIKLGNGIEIDESYFGAKRVRGKRGRGASHKIIVLGLLKRKGKVFTKIIPDASMTEIMPIIRATVKSGSDIYTDGWRSYDALAVYGYNHKKVIHEKDEFVSDSDNSSHINGVESFWSWTKRRLNKFNGVPASRFGGNLLESEWRFNHRNSIEKSLRTLVLEYEQN